MMHPSVYVCVWGGGVANVSWSMRLYEGVELRLLSLFIDESVLLLSLVSNDLDDSGQSPEEGEQLG